MRKNDFDAGGVAANKLPMAQLTSLMGANCPRWMMLIELIRNAIQALVERPGERKKIRILRRDIWYPLRAEDRAEAEKLGYPIEDGMVLVPKTAIWNNCAPLSPDDLIRITKLGESIGKKRGLHDSFGIGAKIASIYSNACGMRYRIGYNNSIWEAVYLKKGEENGLPLFDLEKIPQNGGGVTLVCQIDDDIVAEINDSVAIDGNGTCPEMAYEYDKTKGFFEFAVGGNHYLQDTTKILHDDPVADGDLEFPHPVIMWERFFRIPDNVDIEVEQALLPKSCFGGSGRSKTEKYLRFEPLAEKAFNGFGFFENWDCVEVETPYNAPVKVWFGYDPDSNRHEQFGRWSSMFGIVYDNEIFYKELHGSARNGNMWGYKANAFGIPNSVSKHLWLFVELPSGPEGYPVFQDLTRTKLVYNLTKKNMVPVEDPAIIGIVRDAMPQWLHALIRDSHDSMSADADRRIQERLSDMLDDLRRMIGNNRPAAPVEALDGFPIARRRKRRPNVSAPDVQPSDSVSDTKRLKPTRPPRNPKHVVESVMLPKTRRIDSEQEADETGLDGLVALYSPQTNTLLINMTSPSVKIIRDAMRTEFPKESAHAPDEFHDLVTELTYEHLGVRFGEFAMALRVRRNNPAFVENWQEIASPQALTNLIDTDRAFRSSFKHAVTMDDKFKDIRSSMKAAKKAA